MTRLGGVEHQEACVRSYLEILPGNRHVTFIDPKNPAAGNDQVGDLPGLRNFITMSSTLPRASFWGLRTSVPINCRTGTRYP